MDSKEFLDWAMPRLGLEPRGYARVRGQVAKRLARRLAQLHVGGLPEYVSYLAEHPEEWAVLDQLCHVTISRFFRDRAVFDALARSVLPRLLAHTESRLRIWSAGCGAGEEPYSLLLLWKHALAQRFPHVTLELIATDADAHQLDRARAAAYRPSSFRELPSNIPSLDDVTLANDITFLQQDLRREAPDGPFALVTCRNMAFNYFDEPGKRAALHTIAERLIPGGVLMIGLRERLPDNDQFVSAGDCLFEKRS